MLRHRCGRWLADHTVARIYRGAVPLARTGPGSTCRGRARGRHPQTAYPGQLGISHRRELGNFRPPRHWWFSRRRLTLEPYHRSVGWESGIYEQLSALAMW